MDETKTLSHTRYVIVCMKTAHFVCRIKKVNYSTVFVLSKKFSDALTFDTKEDAEETLNNFMRVSYVKYQNKGDFDFQVKPITISISIALPTTFKCKRCGREHPINEIWASTNSPENFYTGMCNHCANIEYNALMRRQYGSSWDD